MVASERACAYLSTLRNSQEHTKERTGEDRLNTCSGTCGVGASSTFSVSFSFSSSFLPTSERARVEETEPELEEGTVRCSFVAFSSRFFSFSSLFPGCSSSSFAFSARARSRRKERARESEVRHWSSNVPDRGCSHPRRGLRRETRPHPCTGGCALAPWGAVLGLFPPLGTVSGVVKSRCQCHRDRVLSMPKHGPPSSLPATSGTPDATHIASSHHGQPGPARWRHSSGDEATLEEAPPESNLSSSSRQALALS